MKTFFDKLPMLIYSIKILYSLIIIFRVIFNTKKNFISSALKMTIINIISVWILMGLCVLNINANLGYDITSYITCCIIMSLEILIYVVYLAIYLFAKKIPK